MRDTDDGWPDAPDPDGEMPDGWRPIEWVAYGEFHGGASLSAVAERLDRSTGTVMSWRRRWRGVYGPDLLASQAAENLRQNRSEIRHRFAGAYPAGAEPWVGRRVNLASLAGRSAGGYLALADEMLERYAAQVEAGQVVKADDLETVVTTAAKLVAIADRLGGIPTPDRVAGRGAGQGFGAAGGLPPKGVVAALEGRVDPDASAKDTLAAAKKALVGIQALRPNAIEVEGVEK